jgi:hypothetical protein
MTLRGIARFLRSHQFSYETRRPMLPVETAPGVFVALASADRVRVVEDDLGFDPAGGRVEVEDIRALENNL